jgi:hypothetical protein
MLRVEGDRRQRAVLVRFPFVGTPIAVAVILYPHQRAVPVKLYAIDLAVASRRDIDPRNLLGPGILFSVIRPRQPAFSII